MEKEDFFNIVSVDLKKIGFTKKGTCWYKDSLDSVGVVNLQKASYSKQYYFNIAVYMKSLGGERYPKEHDCQLRTRLEELLEKDSRQRLSQVCNLDENLTDSERESFIKSIINNEIASFFVQTETNQKLAELLPRFVGLVHNDARHFLENTEVSSNP